MIKKCYSAGLLSKRKTLGYRKKSQARLLLFIMILQTFITPCISYAQSMSVAQESDIDNSDLIKILTSQDPLVYLGSSAKKLLELEQDYDPRSSIVSLSLLEQAATKKTMSTQMLIPLSVSITDDKTGQITTLMLYQCDDAVVSPSAHYADFSFSFYNPLTQAIEEELFTSPIVDIPDTVSLDDQLHIFDNFRRLNDAYIRTNADQNVDIRMTGSATFLGLITLPAAASHAVSGNPIFINSAGQLGIGTSAGQYTFSSDVFIAPSSTLYVDKINPRSTTATSFGGNVYLLNGKDLDVTGSTRLRTLSVTLGTTLAGTLNVSRDTVLNSTSITNGKDLKVTGSVILTGARDRTSTSNTYLVFDSSIGDLAARNVAPGTPTYTFSSSAYMIQGGTFFTSKIDPRSPTTTTTFGGSISLPNTSTANRGSLQINGSRFLHNWGTSNTFVGANAGNLTMSGASNTAVGSGSFSANTSGATNIAIGANAGNALTTGSNNIHIGNTGVAAETGIIKIGTQGTQAGCYIAGISGNTIVGNAVSVNGSGQLGVVISSRKYKDDIQDMGNTTDNLMKLRPVTFKYKDPKLQGREYGLIAEEVQEVYPELVCYNNDGSPESVRYQSLPAMLLNEYQKLRKEFDLLAARLKFVEDKNQPDPEA